MPDASALHLDQAGAVRAGEALDAGAVDAWLRPIIPTLRGTPRVTQYTGGASNWTYRLRYDGDDLILRRPPAGTKAKSAHDMHREYTVQRALRSFYAYVPEMLAYCDDQSVIGTDFYVMRRIAGVIPRARMPLGWLPDAAAARRLCANVLDALVALHQVNPVHAGLGALGKGPWYPKRQIEGWCERYERARTWNAPGFRSVMTWLAERTPEDVATCVIHNDFRLDNVVLDPREPTQLIGVLDWEMATLGDPLMDLGNSLAYWVQADDDPIARSIRRQPTHLPGMFTRREVVDYYCSRMGFKADNWPFYEVYGLFRLAVIAQQIYYRYHHHETRNRAFRRFWIMPRYLEWRCRRIIGRSRGT